MAFRSRGRGGHGRRSGRGGRGGFVSQLDDEVLRSRKLTSADLQLVLLALLADQPDHGYGLIGRIEEHSDGFYVPSPGMIYPALTCLGEIGYADISQDGQRKLYALNEKGHRYLDEHRAEAQHVLDELERIGDRMDRVRNALRGVDSDGEAPIDLQRARRALRAALRAKHGCEPAEAQRIARILGRATAEILATKSAPN